MRTNPCTRGSFLVLAVAASACSDGTAPSARTFQVIVADTVRPGDMQIRLRNATGSAVELDWCNVRLEQESPAGAWPDPPDPLSSLYLCAAEELAPGYEATVTRNAPLPGRYRFVYPYHLRGSNDRLKAYSNVFVAVP